MDTDMFGERLALADRISDLIDDFIRALDAERSPEAEVKRVQTRLALRLQLRAVIRNPDLFECEGPVVRYEGAAIERPAFTYFIQGCKTAARVLLEMITGNHRWGTSNWEYDRKYRGRLQSAICDLRDFRAMAESYLTGESVLACHRRLGFQRDERFLEGSEARDRLIESAIAEMLKRAESRKREEARELFKEMEIILEGRISDWSAALDALPSRHPQYQRCLASEIHDAKRPLTLDELCDLEGAFDSVPATKDAAREKIKRINERWAKHQVPFAIEEVQVQGNPAFRVEQRAVAVPANNGHTKN